MTSASEEHHQRHGHGPAGGGASGAPGPDVDLDEAFWEGMYRARGPVWGGQPNPQLVAETADLEPGSALDVGCGEGADALWLAQRGWRVTAVDISETALQRARDHAAQARSEVAARITWLHADLSREAPPSGFDLVTAQFVHVPSAQREPLHQRLAAAVSPGGTLLVVGHHASDVHAGVGRWDLPDLLFTGRQVASVLDPGLWEVTIDEDRRRTVTDDQGVERTVRDAVLTARRRPEQRG